MAEIYNDGAMPHGSAVITITATGVQYDCDDFSVPKEKTKTVKRTNRFGEPSGSFGIRDFREGSATVQIATAATPLPASGQEFTADKEGAQIFIVLDVTPPRQKEQYQVAQITFIEKVN